jgi:DNA invertase Pin-like site-specific DNA recombinase
MGEKYIIYYRVSTDKQGKSGLGMKAQEKTVMDFLNGNGHEVIGTYLEVESGDKSDRPELQKAIRACRLKKARMVVAKLDRLSHDLNFITELQKSGVPFVIAQMPDATELTIHIYAALAQHERKLISERTKDALGQLKGKGVKLGNPCLQKGEKIPGSGDTTNANKARVDKADEHARDIAPIIEEMKSKGATSLRETAAALNEDGWKTQREKEYTTAGVRNILKRIENQLLCHPVVPN